MTDDEARRRLYERYGTLHDAIARGDGRRVRKLLRALPELVAYADPAHDGCTPLFVAAARQDLDVLRMLVEAGADVDERDEQKGATVLHWTAYHGLEAACRLLLNAGAAVDSREMCGQTPLHWAARKGRDDVIRTLLAFGADLDAEDTGRRTPLQYAIEQRCRSTVALLAGLGADLDHHDMFGSTPRKDAAADPTVAAILAHSSR